MKVSTLPLTLSLCAFLVVALPAFAEAPPEEDLSDSTLSFAPDRPGFGDATTTVAPMHLALEAGVSQSFAQEGANLELPQVLLRFGLTSWAEVRLQVPGLSLPMDAEGVPLGTPGGIGFKLAYAPHDAVELSWVASFGIPVAEIARGESLFTYASSLNMGVALTPTLALGTTFAGEFSYALDVDDAALDWALGGALALSASFDSTGIYIEGYAKGKDADDLQIALALGVTQMLLPTLQIDVSFEYDLPEYGNGTRVALGIATLF